MGRAKIPMKYIQKEKSRKLAFNQRTNGLRNKIFKFSKSGAKVCLILYNDDDNNVGPMTWPEDPTSVNSMLQEYEHQKIETPPKIFDVKDYFENKKCKAEVAIIKVRKEILKKKYPTWHPNFNNMEENNLISFITIIEKKIEVCNEKIHMLKNNVQPSETNFLQSTPHVQIMVQEGVTVPEMQRCENSEEKPWEYLQIPTSVKLTDDINEMTDFTNLVDLPPSSSTKQLGEVVNCGNEVVNHDDYLANQFADTNDWINQLDPDILNWASQPKEFSWKDFSI
jgi:hypothetical protein